MNIFQYVLFICAVSFLFYITALPHPMAHIIGMFGVFVSAIHYNIMVIRKKLEDKSE